MILGSGETPSVSADRYENLGFLQWMHWSDGRGVGWGHCDPKLVRPHYLREDLVLAQSDVYCRVDEVLQQGFDRFAVEERGFSAESMVQYYSCQMFIVRVFESEILSVSWTVYIESSERFFEVESM